MRPAGALHLGAAVIVIWAFIVTLAMPSFGGPVTARVELTDEAACVKFRKVVVAQLESMRSTAIVGECLQVLRK